MFDADEIWYPVLFLLYLVLIICFVIIVKLKYFRGPQTAGTIMPPPKKRELYEPIPGEESVVVQVYNDYGGCIYLDVGKRHEKILQIINNERVSIALKDYEADEIQGIRRDDVSSEERQNIEIIRSLYIRTVHIAPEQPFDYTVRVHH